MGTGNRRDGDRSPTALACRAARCRCCGISIHERLGLFYDNGRLDTLGDRLSPLVVERGFDSFLDYYYLLKYDEQAADEWRRVMDALSVPETYFWREIDQVRAIVARVVPALVDARAGGAAPDLERAVRQRRGAADHRDGARGGRAGSRAAPIEIHGSDASPAAIEQARAGPLPRALVPQPAAGAAGASISRATATPGRSSPALHRAGHLVERRQLCCEARRRGARARADRVLPERVHLFLARPASRRVVDAVRPRACRPRRTCVVGASESLLRMHDAVRARGDRRRVRLRQAVRRG